MPKIEQYTTTLEKIFIYTDSVRTFRLRFPEGKGFAFQPGQFCMVEVPNGERPKKKAYSIASPAYETGFLDLNVKHVEGGLATDWFWTLKEGDEVRVGGPYGNFFMPSLDKDIVFVSTGTGVAPFRSMLYQLYHDQPDFDGEVWFIFGTRYENEVFYDDEWKAFAAKYPKFHYIPTISRPENWTGQRGYVQQALKECVPDLPNKNILVCGLTPMIEGVQKVAEEMGVDPKQVHFEKYG